MLKNRNIAISHVESRKELNGEVVKGLGEGAHYMKIYSNKFQEAIGYKPFEGTLNLKVSVSRKKSFIDGLSLREIPEFISDKRTFGSVQYSIVTINDEVAGAILLPALAKHPEDIVEVIAQSNLRDELSLKDGMTIRITKK